MLISFSGVTIGWITLLAFSLECSVIWVVAGFLLQIWVEETGRLRAYQSGLEGILKLPTQRELVDRRLWTTAFTSSGS